MTEREAPTRALSALPVTWTSGHLRSPRPGTTFSAAAFLTTLCFVAGMALWGTHPHAGYFYAASMVLGIPVLLAMRPWEAVPRPILIYAAVYAGLLVMCVAHVLFRDASTGTIDYAGRFLLGVVNGFFFYHLLGGNREALFRFIGLVAGAHLAVAIGYTIFVGFDFETLSRLRLRVGGNTNPIPYSLLYISSVGIAALVLADRIRPGRKYFLLAAITLLLTAGLLAAAISASRGTLITVPLLLILVAALLWLRLGMAWSLAHFAIVIGAFLVIAASAFQRDPHLWQTTWEYLFGDADLVGGFSSSSVRYDLWMVAMKLIPEQPLFGHGLSSVPEVLRHPVAGVADNSIFFTFNHVHNEYLDILLKAGIVGAVLFYAPMAIALWVAWRMFADPSRRACALVVVWVVGAQLIYGMTSVMFAHATTTHQFGVYLGMLMFALAGRGQDEPASAR